MQTINLRKASALQSEIRKAISSSGVSDNVIITEYTKDVAGFLEKAVADYVADVTRKVLLNTALFNIRKRVSQANTNKGISDILADVELIDARIAVYNSVSSKSVAKSLDEITSRIEKIKTHPDASSTRVFLHDDRFINVETSVVEQGTIDSSKQFVQELKRQKQTLKDMLLTLNVNSTIDISDFDEMVLKTEGIL
jgi:uncharacterized protein YdcH (DUF465 family)